MELKNVYVIGVFDLFHSGHVNLLKQAKVFGDKLIVAVNGDEMVGKYKRKPIMDQNERLKVVEACRYVDKAFIIEDFDNKRYLIENKINVIVHGDDWADDSYLKQIRIDNNFIETHRIEIKFIPYTEGISTSDIIKKIKSL